MRYALYKEVAKRRRQKRKKRKLNHGGATAGKGEDGSQDSSEGEDSDDDDDDDEQPETAERANMPQQQPNNGQPPAQSGSQNSLWQDDSQDVRMVAVPETAAGPSARGGVPPERYVKQPPLLKTLQLIQHLSSVTDSSYSDLEWQTCLPHNYRMRSRSSWRSL